MLTRLLIKLFVRISELTSESRLQPKEWRRGQGGKKRLFIDVTNASHLQTAVGVSRVTEEISKALLARHPAVEFCFFSLDSKGLFVDQKVWAENKIGAPIDSLGSGDSPPLAGDVILALDLSLPPFHLRPSQIRKLRERGAKVFFFVYDLLPITHPQYFKFRKKFIFLVWLESVKQANGVFAISRWVEGQIKDQAIFGKRFVGPSISTVPLGAFSAPSSPGLSSVKNLRSAVPTVLMVGTLEPRKGYFEALEVFECLWRRRRFAFRLVIVGQRGWRCDREVRKIERLSRKGMNINWIRDVDDSELSGWYRSADLLVANSAEEGFGLPLVEARHYRLPVLCREIASFQEVAGDWATFFRNREDLEHRLEELLMSQVARPNDAQDSESPRPDQAWKSAASKILSVTDLQLCSKEGSRGEQI